MVKNEVILFGGSGAGKTALLASMLHESTRAMLDDGLDLRIYPEEGTDLHLIDAQELLEFSFVEGPYESTFALLDTTQQLDKFRFHFGQEGEDPELTLDFIDTPGEWTPRHEPRLLERLGHARAAILVVDAVELLCGERIHPRVRRNSPNHAHRLVQKWLHAAPGQSLLLCIVPVKGETWLRQRDGFDARAGARQLRQTLRARYDLLFQEVKSHASRVAVVIAPVQTVGNLTFDRYEEREGGYPDEYWKKTRGTKTPQQAATGYAPLHTDQPLRHILNWLLIEEIAKRRAARESDFSKDLRGFLEVFDRVFDSSLAEKVEAVRSAFLDVFGADRKLARAVSRFVGGVKTSEPFEVTQGESLVKRGSIFWDLVEQ